MADTLDDLLTRDAYEALWESRLATNGVGAITAATFRDYMRSTAANLDPRAGVLTGANVDDFNVPSTQPNAVKLSTFNLAPASDGLLFSPNAATDAIGVAKSCRCPFTFRFNGAWNTGEDINFELRINDAVPSNPANQVTISKEGKGSSDPEYLSATAVNLVISAADIAAGSGGYAWVSLWVYSTTGAFTVDQISATFGLSYTPFTAGAF